MRPLNDNENNMTYPDHFKIKAFNGGGYSITTERHQSNISPFEVAICGNTSPGDVREIFEEIIAKNPEIQFSKLALRGDQLSAEAARTAIMYLNARPTFYILCLRDLAPEVYAAAISALQITQQHILALELPDLPMEAASQLTAQLSERRVPLGYIEINMQDEMEDEDIKAILSNMHKTAHSTTEIFINLNSEDSVQSFIDNIPIMTHIERFTINTPSKESSERIDNAMREIFNIEEEPSETISDNGGEGGFQNEYYDCSPKQVATATSDLFHDRKRQHEDDDDSTHKKPRGDGPAM